jgi:hypothetical protein
MRIGGGRLSFPLLTQEELGLISTPYSQWAPAPYNKLNYSCMDRLEPMFLRQETKELTKFPLMQFLSRLRPLKAKLMLGMVPISGDRWIERKMDDPANYRNLFELMQDLRGVLTQLEWTLGIPMTGFKGYKTSDALKDLPAEQRHDLWGKVIGGMPFQKAILDAQDKADAELAANPPSVEERMDIMKQSRMPTHPRFRDTENLIGHYEEGKRNRDETRLVLCGPPKLLTQEHWITILRQRMDFYA